jgi:hypothetical protein
MTAITVNASAPAEFETPITGVPDDIQWMPPGVHEVWPDGFESPVTVNVQPEVARIANTQLQELRRVAAAGGGSWPFMDFNHEDGEQSGEPLEFFWGGNDPKTGGVRLRVSWSHAGEQAIKGRSWRSFSPSWRMHKKNNAFLGIGLNVGGLVNRPAFKSIQIAAKGRAEQFGQIGHEIFARAAHLARKESLSCQAAFNRVAGENPRIWENYLVQLTGNPRTQGKPVLENLPPFQEVVAAVAAREGLDFGRAIALVIAKAPRLYEDYCSALDGSTRPPTDDEIKMAQGEIGHDHGFKRAVEDLVKKQGVASQLAPKIVARRDPALYKDWIAIHKSAGLEVPHGEKLLGV